MTGQATRTPTPRGTHSTPPGTSAPRRGRLRSLALAGLLAASLTTAALASSAQAASKVPLGTASEFAVLAGTSVTNTGPTRITTRDVGVFPGTSVTGFPPGRLIKGVIRRGDSVAAKAKLDLRSAYNNAEGQSTTEAVPGGDLTGRTLRPGVYSADSSLFLNGPLTLDGRGDPDAVFIFKAGSSLLVSVDSNVNLTGEARPGNVFWQVGSSATIGVNSAFVGNILAEASIKLNTGARLNGRALALTGAVTLDGLEGSITPFGGINIGQYSVGNALRYVALGDSYSSGEGLGEKGAFPPYQKLGAKACHRHDLAYPEIFAWQGRLTALDFFACTGARTEHIDRKTQRRGEPAPQAKRPQLNKRTHLVTITIGGNDGGKAGKDGSGGLGEPLTFCYKHKNCHKDKGFRKRLERRFKALQKNLQRSLTAIKRPTSRNTAIVMLGYPRVFPTDRDRDQLKEEQKCAASELAIPIPGTFPPREAKFRWEPAEQAFLNGATDRLNALSFLAARRVGVRYYDVTKTFTGHANCDRNGEKWINGYIPRGITGFAPGSFHPNRAGQVAYRNILRTALTLDVRAIEKRGGRLTSVNLPPNPRPRR